jgi:hypothetical protein
MAGPIRKAILIGALLSLWNASTAVRAHDPIGGRVTWTNDIAPIVKARCGSCHVAGRAEPMPLTTYEEVEPWVSAIRQQVLSRRMPIWHAARGFGAFLNDPTLSPFEITLITTWANAGGPRGEANPRTPVQMAAAEPSAPTPDARHTREVALACGVQRLSGRLLAVNPRLEQGGSATIIALFPDGRREVVAWIRDYDPRYPTTYWLRTPLVLPPGSRVEIAPTGECRVTATLAR